MKKTVYLIEDDTGIREMLEYLLINIQCKVFSYATARLFLEKMETELPDLIILDIMLPDGNGEAICRQLKLNAETNHVPVLLMSANFSQDTYADDFITKPFEIDDFMERTQVLLSA